MALFEMNRFMGEDEEIQEEEEKDRANTILRKLEKEAKKRGKKRKSSVVESNDNLKETNSKESSDTMHESSVKKKKKKKSKEIEEIEECVTSEQNDEEVSEEKLESPKKKRKKPNKKEHGDSADENGVVEENAAKTLTESENDGKPSSKKKSKKGKERSSKTGTDKVASAVKPKDVEEEEEKEEEEEEEEEEETTLPVIKEGPNEIGGFTVLGDYKPKSMEKVKRVLPHWLANPAVISKDLLAEKKPVSDMPGLDPDLVEKLHENEITHFFPVQLHVIPILLDSIQMGHLVGRAGYRPRDICVSAPTGSGKTLAFVIPIVQALRRRVTCRVRALVVLPVRDLAMQVFKVFQTYCEGTPLKVVLTIGQKFLSQEQRSLVEKRMGGYYSLADIVITTPGKLVDHINKTEGFDLTSLRFLVLDEADRMMDDVKQDWISQVEGAVFKGSRRRPGPLTAASCARYDLPLQKLLYSATLSQNPEKIMELNLFQPKLFTSVVKVTHTPQKPNQDQLEGSAKKGDTEKGSFKTEEFSGKYTTPPGLEEFCMEAKENNKPLLVLYILHHLKYRQVLCFTQSVEDTHRLCSLIKLVGGINVVEFSSNLHTEKRKKLVKSFEAGKIDIIVCSDVMTRGMDLENVKYVVSYNPPRYIKTYIHRIGRTARAGKPGTAITLLESAEFYPFKKMLHEVGKKKPRVMEVEKAGLKALVPGFKKALSQLKIAVTGKK